ncbi:unnamed protein product [Parajaminaea phylloscopi]
MSRPVRPFKAAPSANVRPRGWHPQQANAPPLSLLLCLAIEGRQFPLLVAQDYSNGPKVRTIAQSFADDFRKMIDSLKCALESETADGLVMRRPRHSRL